MKMHVLFFAISLLINTLCIAQDQQTSDNMRIVAGIDLQRYDDKLYYYASELTPFSGILRDNFPSGKTKRDIFYENGVEVKIVEWYENGQMQSEFFYQDTMSVGIGSKWYDTGSKKSEHVFENGEEITIKEWFSNSKPQLVQHFKNGKKNGYWIEYYNNGNPKVEGKYVNDHRVGKWTKYFQNGTIEKERVFLK